MNSRIPLKKTLSSQYKLRSTENLEILFLILSFIVFFGPFFYLYFATGRLISDNYFITRYALIELLLLPLTVTSFYIGIKILYTQKITLPYSMLLGFITVLGLLILFSTYTGLLVIGWPLPEGTNRLEYLIDYIH